MLLMDNRGVGRSASPQDKAQYTTSLMAQDILGILVRPVLALEGCRLLHIVACRQAQAATRRFCCRLGRARLSNPA